MRPPHRREQPVQTTTVPAAAKETPKLSLFEKFSTLFERHGLVGFSHAVDRRTNERQIVLQFGKTTARGSSLQEVIERAYEMALPTKCPKCGSRSYSKLFGEHDGTNFSASSCSDCQKVDANVKTEDAVETQAEAE